MSRTDKDTPYWVLEKTSPARHEYHDHKRANNHGVLAHNGEHFCSIDELHSHGKARHRSGRRVWTKYQTRLEQHINSGTCKKSYVTPFQCNHDIFDQSINNRYGCPKNTSWRKIQEKWDMEADYSWREVLEWIELNGIVSHHTIDKRIYAPNAPCKCDAWTFYDDCGYEIDRNDLDHGLTGWGRWKWDDRENGYHMADLDRRAWREELNNARFIDWRNELELDFA